MEVLVTGATSPLGQRLVARLANDGHGVRILTRRPFHSALSALASLGRVATHEWHPISEAVPPAAIDGADSIIHLSGEPLGGQATAERMALMAASRLLVTERLVAAMPGSGGRLIAASIALAASRERGRDGDVMTEATPRSVPAAGFEAAVLAWEAAAQAAQSKGASVAIVRLGLLLNEGAFWNGVVRLASLGLQPDLRNAQIPCIATDDAASLLAGLLQRPDLEGPIHGVAPLPLKGEDLAAMLDSICPLPFHLRLGPRRAQRLLGPLALVLATRARIVPRRLAEAGAAFTEPDPRQRAARLIASIRATQARSSWRGVGFYAPVATPVPIGHATPVPPSPQ